MSTTTQQLPINETAAPADQQELIDAVKTAYDSETPIYPIGGGTSLDFGLPARRDGIAVSLAKLNRVIDYPARDMTVTVEAGITMRELARRLAAERQRLPVDVPQADQATLGGVVATNWNGPRRYGFGHLRDYVIGISAVDGRGSLFKGGGRVVKNVAGYDFCKLLTGSLGTLGVVTQVTLKLKPTAERFVLLKCVVTDWDHAQTCLGNLGVVQAIPSAIELVSGPVWNQHPAFVTSSQESGPPKLHLVVALEGTAAEVAWSQEQIIQQWHDAGVKDGLVLDDEQAEDLWQCLVEFPAGDAPLVVKANVVPSGTTAIIRAAREIDPQCSVQAHAGNGVVIVRFSQFPTDGLSRTIVGRLQPVASSLQGNIIVLSNPSGSEMTHRCVWGGANAPYGLMTKIKQQFDPKDILNPGRFVYLSK